MRVNIDYGEAMEGIYADISRMQNLAEKEEKTVLKQIGKAVKGNVERCMVRSNVEDTAVNVSPANYDGSRPYVHMQDDVTYSVRKSARGEWYVSVRGGKMTGHKWHIVNNGAYKIPAKRFIERATERSQGEINEIINKMIKKVIQ